MKGPGSTVHYPLSWCPIRKRRDTATAHGSSTLTIGVTLESSILSSSNITRNFWYLHPHLHFGVHADVDCKCVAAALFFSHCNKPIRAHCAHPCQRQIWITRHLARNIFLSGVFDRLGLSFFVAILTLISLSRRTISDENTVPTSSKAQILEEACSGGWTRYTRSFSSGNCNIPICEDA
ncbi:hypothetical protein COCMIDRAFT_34004 [Bipolaris oryzae ATCC 44560]|uniref:Uncharacterized protein n=1 Tax=Bipolaris oryzae ATCC 44560 TaxID=930090 RepID=W6Z9V4_COCMI|nr:uncharacterized protein COCMIDRAFT_34004 [Bipolaris oryzae ATCC 44560]EUC48522.1 hypothetical protein COCMIDRAFT_34004 [Bipolaris oryzae ATCC 44560]